MDGSFLLLILNYSLTMNSGLVSAWAASFVASAWTGIWPGDFEEVEAALSDCNDRRSGWWECGGGLLDGASSGCFNRWICSLATVVALPSFVGGRSL